MSLLNVLLLSITEGRSGQIKRFEIRFIHSTACVINSKENISIKKKKSRMQSKRSKKLDNWRGVDILQDKLLTLEND